MEVLLDYNGIIVKFRMNKNYPKLVLPRSLLHNYFNNHKDVPPSQERHDVVFNPTGKEKVWEGGEILTVWEGADKYEEIET